MCISIYLSGPFDGKPFRWHPICHTISQLFMVTAILESDTHTGTDTNIVEPINFIYIICWYKTLYIYIITRINLIDFIIKFQRPIWEIWLQHLINNETMIIKDKAVIMWANLTKDKLLYDNVVCINCMLPAIILYSIKDFTHIQLILFSMNDKNIKCDIQFMNIIQHS